MPNKVNFTSVGIVHKRLVNVIVCTNTPEINLPNLILMLNLVIEPLDSFNAYRYFKAVGVCYTMNIDELGKIQRIFCNNNSFLINK